MMVLLYDKESEHATGNAAASRHSGKPGSHLGDGNVIDQIKMPATVSGAGIIP